MNRQFLIHYRNLREALRRTQLLTFSPIGFGLRIESRRKHSTAQHSGILPHQDARFVSKLSNSASEEDIDSIWAILGASYNRESLKNVVQLAETLAKSPIDMLRICTIAFRSRYLTEDKYKFLMMQMYAKAGFLQHSQQMLAETLKRGVAPQMEAWHILVQAGQARRQPDFSQQIISYMESHGLSPPKKILKTLMDAYADKRMPDKAIDVLDLMRTRGMYVDVHMYTVCVKACIGSTMSTDHIDLMVKNILEDFDQVPHRLWTTILMAYASTGNVKKVIAHADAMIAMGMELNARDYTAILRSCRESRDVMIGKEMLRRVEEAAVDWEVSLATEMIRLYALCGNLNKSIRVFDQVLMSDLDPDKGIFNVMIDIMMNNWSDAIVPKERKHYMGHAKRAFEAAWARGIFDSQSVSRRGLTTHVDLHRSGLWTAQFIIIKTIQRALEEYESGKGIGAIKFIAGRGKSHQGKNLSLADVVRIFLSQSHIKHFEDSFGVFNIPKSYLESRFRSGKKSDESGFSWTDPRLLL